MKSVALRSQSDNASLASIFELVGFSSCHRRAASMAPGPVNAVGSVVGCATGGVGDACAGSWTSAGMLTNCSLMNSFNSNISARSPDATVIRSWVLSAKSSCFHDQDQCE